MTCVECGAEMGTARDCSQCGAPVPEHPRHVAPGTRPAIQQAAKWEKAVVAFGQAVFILTSLLSLAVVIYAAVGFVGDIAEGSSAQDPNYIPPWAYASWILICGVIPAVSVAILVRHLRKRRAIAPGSPEPRPETLD
jgi:hypothetical protein